MEKQQLAAEKEAKKHSRRTRQETRESRDYKCGCGKTYLSYPALYLHLKNKHDGKIQEGTILPNQQQKQQKGRPKKTEFFLFKQQERFDDKSIQNLQLYFQKMDNKYIQEFQLHSQQVKQNIEIIQQSLLYFPKQIQEKNNKFYQEFQQILNQDKQLEENKNDKQLYSTKIITVLAIFLIRTLIYLNFSIFKEIAFFLITFINFLNQLDKNDIYCETHDCQDINEFCNDFIQNYLPQQLQLQQQKTLIKI